MIDPIIYSFYLTVVVLACSTQNKSRKNLLTLKNSFLRPTANHSDHRQAVYNIIHKLHELQVKKLAIEAEKKDIEAMEFKQILKELEQKGLVYSPKPGVVGCVE